MQTEAFENALNELAKNIKFRKLEITFKKGNQHSIKNNKTSNKTGHLPTKPLIYLSVLKRNTKNSCKFQ